MKLEEEIEIWKDIPGHEGLYQVSNLGRIKSLEKIKLNQGKNIFKTKEKILKLNPDGSGYLQCGLYKDNNNKNAKAHKLVAIAFLGHKPDGTTKIVVDHINNIKTDNKLKNLQLINHRENTNKDRISKTSKHIGVCWGLEKEKWRVNMQINRKQIFLGYSECELEAAEMYQKALQNLHFYENCPKTFREKLKTIKNESNN